MDKRGPAKRLKSKDHFTFTLISAKGEPLEPKNAATAFKNQCGVLVRDRIPISYKEWNKTKKYNRDGEYVPNRDKKDLLDDLMPHFSLPDRPTESDRNKLKELVMKFALQKMGELFRQWKKRLWANYKKEKKPPQFTGYLLQQEENWDKFVEHKNSEDAKAKSVKNKENAAKKIHHHKTGRGGYRTAMPKWAEQEREMIRNNVTPEPIREKWDIRSRNWFLAHGCVYDMKTGNLVQKTDNVKIPRERWLHVTEEIKAGRLKFVPDRENDLLTFVLGNPEKGGRA